MWTPAWCHWSPSLTSKQAHQEVATHWNNHQPRPFTSLPKYLPFIAVLPLPHIFMDITYTDCLFTSRSQDIHFPATNPSPGRHLATHTALSFSTFQGSTGHPTVYMQSLRACSTYIPPVLPLLWPPAHTCRSGDTPVLCYLLGWYQRPPAWAIIGYLYGVWALHINMGLSDPLKGTLWLHKCLQPIHIQSNPESHKLAFKFNLLVLAQALHQFPAQKVLWAALTMAHFGLLWTGKFTVDQEHFDPTWHCASRMWHLA